MPGTFAHITLADTLSGNADLLDSIKSVTPDVKRALLKFRNYCELGAVSPDYPYLTLLDGHAAGWANAMHYHGTTDFIRRAVPFICGLQDSVARQKCIAWLFGFTTHVVADVAVHPVVNLRVGPYEHNKTEHRLCEMNQDVYIFSAKGLGEVTTAEYVRRSGIGSCVDGQGKLDDAIVDLWLHCLASVPMHGEVKTGIKGPDAEPNPRQWHDAFMLIIDGIAEEGGRLPPLSRHFAESKGLVYPELHELNPTYLKGLRTPEGKLEDYDSIFGRAQEHAVMAWDQLGQALAQKSPDPFMLANADLDTGTAEDDARLLFWSANT